MKVAKFERLKVGDLVQVPRTQFAPQRTGWNGWLFSNAVVVSKGTGSKSGKPVVKVRMQIDAHGVNAYKTIEKVYSSAHIFETTAIGNAQAILQRDGIQTKEECEEMLDREHSGANWIRFLLDEGFLF